MTPEEFYSFAARVDSLSDEIAPTVQKRMESLKLTKDEIAILATIPEEVKSLVEEKLSQFTPSQIDVREELVWKGVAQIFSAIPQMSKAMDIGYEMGALT